MVDRSVDINDRMFSWKISIKDHPIVGTAFWQFETLLDLERFYGKNDIQKDNVKSITHYNRYENRFIEYKISETIHISTTRLTLKEVGEE